MIFPFLRRKFTNVLLNSAEHRFSEQAQHYLELQKEYTRRLAHFESNIPEDLFKEYIDLRACGNKLISLEEQLNYLQGDLYMIRKDLSI